MGGAYEERIEGTLNGAALDGVGARTHTLALSRS